mmetsp:Transcript_11412/g.22393  ORF Transcript_11412/g.22393 Transcript_11412/m.22393 type:complete len:236 (-) Transcript_11412:48-755(-)
MGLACSLCSSKGESALLNAETLIKDFEEDFPSISYDNRTWVDAMRRVYAGSNILNLAQLRKAGHEVMFDIDEFYRQMGDEKNYLNSFIKANPTDFVYARMIALTLHFSSGPVEDKVKSFMLALTLDKHSEVTVAVFTDQLNFLLELSLKIVPQLVKRKHNLAEIAKYSNRLKIVKPNLVKYYTKLFFGLSNKIEADKLEAMLLTSKEGKLLMTASALRSFAEKLFFMHANNLNAE